MSEMDTYTPWRPGIKLYVLAVLLGTILAVVLSVSVFATSSIVISTLMGTIMALFGALMDENIGEAIVLSVIVGGMCGLLFWLAPEPVATWVGTWAVPAVLGFCASKLVIGLARELGDRRQA